MAALLLCAAACGKADGLTDTDSGTGNVVLSIGSAPEVTVTKAVTRTAKDGNVMNFLSVWIVNRESGEILVHEHLLPKGLTAGGEEVAGGSNSTSAALDYIRFAEDGKSAEMKFVDIPRGNCTLYAVANCTSLDDGEYVVGATIDDGFRNMLISETIESGKAPAYDGTDGMPCSAVVDFSISAGENKVSAQMLRCVGRLTIAVRNNIAESSLFFKEVGLSAQNPTNAYVFEHDGGEIPASSRDVAFPELAEMKRVDAMTTDPVTIYDTYLYETSPESSSPQSFTFSLFGAVYRKTAVTEDVKIGYRQEYNFAANISSGATTSDMFVLRSAASGNYYIGDTDGRLVYRFFSGDTELRHHKDIENYFWRFSGSTYSTITNVGTGRQIRLSGETVSMVEAGQGSTFSLISNDTISGGTGTGLSNGLRFSTGGYELTIAPEYGIIGTTGRTDKLETHWIFRKVTEGAAAAIPYFIGAEYEIPKVDRTMTYIDGFGIARELNHISRNEHVRLNIGIFYNREFAQFDFEVEEWREKESETTFD